MALKKTTTKTASKSTAKKSPAKKTTTAQTKTTAPKTTAKKKNPALEKLVADINKKFGENAVSVGVLRNDDGSVKTVQRIPTGSIALDVALGGGIPIGRYIEISGGLSTTKTTQCIHIVRQAQKMGLQCGWFDIEGTTDEPYLIACGVDPDLLLYSRPDGMEEATQMAIDMQRSGVVDLVVIDSIAMLSPTKEQESTMDESTQMGLAPKLLGEFFRKIAAGNNRLFREGKPEFTVIGINQLREKIGAYGNPEYTPGGRAKGFMQSIDIRLRRGDWITQGSGKDKEFVGQVVKFMIEKNKTFKRMQTGEFDFYYMPNSAGVTPNYNDNEKSIVILGIEWGLIQKSGAWFSYNGQKYQGVPALTEALRNDEKLFDELYKEVFKMTSQKLGA